VSLVEQLTQRFPLSKPTQVQVKRISYHKRHLGSMSKVPFVVVYRIQGQSVVRIELAWPLACTSPFIGVNTAHLGQVKLRPGTNYWILMSGEVLNPDNTIIIGNIASHLLSIKEGKLLGIRAIHSPKVSPNVTHWHMFNI